MFIHIGGDTMVRMKDVIGIFDIETARYPEPAADAHASHQKDIAEVVEAGDIKSFVVTVNKQYYSPISSLTLKKRAQDLGFGAVHEADAP